MSEPIIYRDLPDSGPFHLQIDNPGKSITIGTEPGDLLDLADALTKAAEAFGADSRRDVPDSPRDVPAGHDERCESDWNGDVCACLERAENARQPWPPLRGKSPEPVRRWRRILTHLIRVR